MELVAIGFRFVLGTVFLLAGLAKLPRRREFVSVVRAYDVLPSRLVAPVARGVPRLELLMGVLLMIGLGTRWVALLVAIVLAFFSAAVGINLARGRDLDCGCFAVGAPRRITWSLVARNAILVAMSAIVAGSVTRGFALDEVVWGSAGKSVAHSDAVALLFAATVAVLAVTLVGEILQLRVRRAEFVHLADRVDA
jgi:uncharacterized membrane protein YphA (DoxX/SURF4 family)